MLLSCATWSWVIQITSVKNLSLPVKIKVIKELGNDIFLVHHESYLYLWLYYAIELIIVAMIMSKYITLPSHIHPMVDIGRYVHGVAPEL